MVVTFSNTLPLSRPLPGATWDCSPQEDLQNKLLATKKELDEATSAATATTDAAAREYAGRKNIEKEERVVEYEQQLVRSTDRRGGSPSFANCFQVFNFNFDPNLYKI